MYSRKPKRVVQRVLAIGAHPDDIEYGAGGTIACHVRAGHDVTFLVMTCGERGGATGRVRKREAHESAHILGVRSVIFAGFRDTMVGEGIRTIHRIEKVVQRNRPSRVYIPFPRDPHQDHHNTASASISATRMVPQVLAYESPLGVTNFAPTYYAPIDDGISVKLRALSCFGSQRHKDYLKRSSIEGLAKFRGFQVGTKYAEAFEIVRFVDRVS
jgi:LmbE family N-acetylglucosaminyl deacetylase